MAGKIMIQMEDGSLMEVSPNDPMSFDEESGTLSKKKGLSDLAKQMGSDYAKGKVKDEVLDYAKSQLAPAASEQIAQGAAQTAAENAAYNSAATGGEVLPEVALDSASPSMLGQGLGAAGAAYGAYNAYQGVKSGNKVQAGLGGAGVGLGLNAMGYALGPYGWAAMLAAPVIASTFAHESTRDKTAKRTEELKGLSSDPNYQKYVEGMREQYKSAPTGKAYAGKYDTFDEYKKAGLEAADLTGVYGNIKAFGPDWAKLDQAKREQVTQGLIDANLYDSKKGDVILTDEAKAKQIYASLASIQPGNATPRPVVQTQRSEPQKKAEKKAKLEQIIPELKAPTALAPRYDINLSEIYRNPYL